MLMNTILISVFALLIAFQVKHFVVDYIFQSMRKDSMQKFNHHDWVWPLTKHAFDHAAFTFLISVVFLVYL